MFLNNEKSVFSESSKLALFHDRDGDVMLAANFSSNNFREEIGFLLMSLKSEAMGVRKKCYELS